MLKSLNKLQAGDHQSAWALPRVTKKTRLELQTRSELGDSCCVPCRRQGTKAVLGAWLTHKTLLNELPGMTHASSHIWVASLAALNVLQVPGNALPRIKCTSCWAGCVHTPPCVMLTATGDGAGSGPLTEAEPPRRSPPAPFPMSLRSHQRSKILGPGQDGIPWVSMLRAPGPILEPR